MRGFVRLADRALLRVAGEGSGKFLQGLCTQDVGVLATQPAAPAAFLSPKGRVLCDSILVARGKDEFLIDCHSSVSKSLMRLLLRHRLREPLAIEDVSATHAAVALLPGEALPHMQNLQALYLDGNQIKDDGAKALGEADAPSSAGPPSEFFADPRFSAMGHRAVLQADAVASLCEATPGLEAYHHWRVCCAVPEGPADLPADSVLPLHGNLDLLNFVSFSKGCYVGQELTARTKHRGAVRRRFFSVIAADGDPEDFLAGLQLPLHSPLPSSAPAAAQLPAPEAGEAARAVAARRPDAEEEEKVGMLHSTSGAAGLCLLKCRGAFNEAASFRDAPQPAGTRFTTAEGAVALAVRPPPYAFVE